MSTVEIDPTFGVDLGDGRIWAEAVIASQRKLGKTPPKVADLEAAILDIDIDDTIKGSSTITLSLADPDWELVSTGFLDADEDGRLDAIEVNYPVGSDLNWRLTQVGFDMDSGTTLTMTFMERAAVYLMQHRGPLKTSRAKKTRAEFLALCASYVKANGGLNFRCSELKTVQPIDKVVEPKSKAKRKKEKAGGIASGLSLTIKGVPASDAQRKNVEIALDVATAEKANKLATEALIVGGIGESSFMAVMNAAGSPYGGVWQGNVRSGLWEADDTAGMAKSFLRGGKGFQGGGAIALSKNKDLAPGGIALLVEGSVSNFGGDVLKGTLFYNQHLPEARQWIKAYGGMSADAGGPETYRKEYNFQIGSPEDPKETFWDGMNRLADEVKWPLFVDGDDVYYDPETELIRQKPSLVLTPDHKSLIKLSGTWDQRNIATDLTVELICSPFEFRAGEVFQLLGFGPFSTGSTAKLPGRWLISDVSRKRFELTSTFTLKQPEKPAPEPAPETGTVSDDSDSSGTLTGGSARDRVVKAAKSSLSTKTKHNYYLMGGTQTPSHLADMTANAPYRSDCSQWAHAVYLKAGLPSPGLTTGEQAAKGTRTTNPQPGDLMLTPSHVEIYIGGEGPPGKNTIGHGSPPIDYSNTSAYPGHFFVTFDFLQG